MAQARPVPGPTRGGLNQIQPPPKPPTPPAAASPAPAPSAPAPPSGLPWDAQAEREWGSGEQRYRDTLGGIQGNWAAYEARLGGNPYSQADLLQAEHSYWAGGANSTLGGLMRGRDAGYRATANGAGLGLYSGATAGRRFRVGTGYLGDLGAIQRDYSIAEANRNRESDAARHDWEAEQAGIKEGAAQRRAESEAPPEPAPVGGGDGGGGGGGGSDPSKPGLGGDPAHPNAYRAGVGAGKPKPNAPPGYHAYKGPNNQWWFAPNR